MSRFAIQQIALNATSYAGVSGYQVDRGLEVQSEGSDGVVYETAHHLMRRKPMADLSSLALKTMLTALNGGTDFPVLNLDGTNGLVMVGAKQAANAVGYAGTSVHVARTGLRGLVYMSRLSWSAGGSALMGLKAMFLSVDGQTDAIVESTVALPSQPVPDFRFILSAASVAGSAIPGVNSVEIAVDPKFEFDYSAGLPDPMLIAGAGVRGKLAITARVDVGDLDLGAGVGATSFTFKRLASGGGFSTDSATFTLNGRWSSEQSIGGENGRDMTRGLLVRTTWDGTNKPMTWATT